VKNKLGTWYGERLRLRDLVVNFPFFCAKSCLQWQLFTSLPRHYEFAMILLTPVVEVPILILWYRLIRTPLLMIWQRIFACQSITSQQKMLIWIMWNRLHWTHSWRHLILVLGFSKKWDGRGRVLGRMSKVCF
jgi:hypothetical protein